MVVSGFSVKLVCLLILTSVFYIAKITPFSPVYYLQPIIATVLLVYIVKIKLNEKITFQTLSEIIFSLLLVLFVSLYFLLNVSILNGGGATLVNLLVGLYSFVAITYLRVKSNLVKVMSSIKLSITLVCFIFVVDSTYRILNPSMPTEAAMEAVEGTSNYFYVFKFNTLMFADSNTVAIACLSFFCLLTYLTNRFSVKTKFLRFLFFILILSTLSRAAILVIIVFYFYSSKRISWLLKVHVTFFAGTLVAALLVEFSNDGSLLSKLYIIMAFFGYFESIDVTSFLFGVGLDNSPSVLGGIYSHIHFVTALVEAGFFGFILIAIFLGVSVYITRMQSLYIIIPNLFVGLSYFFYLGSPFVFVPIAIICFLERNFISNSKDKVMI